MTTNLMAQETDERASLLASLRAQLIAEAARTRRDPGGREPRVDLKWWEFFTIPNA